MRKTHTIRNSARKLSRILAALSFVILFAITGCAKNNTQSSSTLASEDVKLVDGVQQVTLGWGKFNYYPEVIKVKQGTPVRITADMKRLQGCFRSFEIPDMKISKYLTPGDNTIEFTPTRTGTFGFGCSMGMGAGKLVVE